MILRIAGATCDPVACGLSRFCVVPLLPEVRDDRLLRIGLLAPYAVVLETSYQTLTLCCNSDATRGKPARLSEYRTLVLIIGLGRCSDVAK